jgi:hypothetical protein
MVLGHGVFLKVIDGKKVVVVYVNKKGDQQNKQINCGLRSLPWLLFVQRYGIHQAKNI